MNENEMSKIKNSTKLFLSDKDYKQALNQIREKLKYYKNDLDFEPWSIYPITGETLFDILQIIDKVLGGSDETL